MVKFCIMQVLFGSTLYKTKFVNTCVIQVVLSLKICESFLNSNFSVQCSSELTSKEEKCLSESLICEVYGKNAYHRKFIQNLKKCFKTS